VAPARTIAYTAVSFVDSKLFGFWGATLGRRRTDWARSRARAEDQY
jgi:hypothetical protein